MFPYREVEVKYGDELEQVRNTKDSQLVTLGAEAQEIANNAVLESKQLRFGAERTAQQAERNAEKLVAKVEKERLRQMEAHLRTLWDIERRIETERLEADQRVMAIEEETQALYDAGEAAIRHVSSERDAARTRAREQRASCERQAEQRCREVEQYERSVLLQTRAAAAEGESQCSRRVQEAEHKCEALRAHYDDAIRQTRRHVAKSVEELLATGTEARFRSARNRENVDGHLQHQRQLQLQANADQFLDAQALVDNSRHRLREGVGLSALSLAAKEVDGVLKGLRGLDSVDEETYIQALHDLARKLRNGVFSTPPARSGKSLGS